MKQSQAKKRDNAMTNKILMGLIALVLGLLFLEILIVHSTNNKRMPQTRYRQHVSWLMGTCSIMTLSI